MNRRDMQLVELEKMALKHKIYDIIISALIVTLHDEFEFGEEKLDQVMQGIAKECDAMSKGWIGYRDYKTYAEEKTGINLGDYYEEL